MKRKEVDDVLGGPDAWANVDKTDGKYYLIFALFFLFSYGERSLSKSCV